MTRRAAPPASLCFALALSLAATAGCDGPSGAKPSDKHDGGADTTAPPSFDYPLDAVLRLNQIQIKATHNSYHVETEGNTIPALAYSHVKLAEQLAAQGVRGLELDVHYSHLSKEFNVFHESYFDEGTTCRSFVTCLEEIKGWSD